MRAVVDRAETLCQARPVLPSVGGDSETVASGRFGVKGPPFTVANGGFGVKRTPVPSGFPLGVRGFPLGVHAVRSSPPAILSAIAMSSRRWERVMVLCSM